MPNYLASVAAATAIVGYDLFKDLVFVRTQNHRAITGLACKGSAAAGDSEVELYVGERRIGNFFNNNTGFPNRDDLLSLEALLVPAGAQIRCIVKDAPVTSPLNIMIVLQDVS